LKGKEKTDFQIRSEGLIFKFLALIFLFTFGTEEILKG